jgi:tetratricopeptide (TPR) repeat protein
MKKRWINDIVIICSIIVLHSACSHILQGPDGARRTDRVDPPVNAYYLFAQAHLEMKNGNMDIARSLLTDAIALDPGSAYLKRELAGLYLMQKNTATAVSLLEAILAEHPDDVETLILAGRVYQSLDEPDKAIDAYSRVLAIDTSRENIYLTLGGMYMDREAYVDAKRVYEQLVTNYPGAYAGYFFLGRISAIEGDSDTARKYFEKTLVLEPDLMESRFALGELYESEKKYKTAAKIYRVILKRDPDNLAASIALAYVDYLRGMKDTAAAALAALGRQSRDDQDIVRILVRNYLDTRKYMASTVIIDGMLKGAPESSDLNYLAGVALDGAEKKKSAIAHLRQVTPESRFYENATVHAALLYQELGALDQAVAFMQQRIENTPQNPEFHLYLGSFYEQMEDYAKAEQALKAGLAIDPENARIYFRLGVVYDKWGKKDASIEAMRTVLEYEPDNANALNYLGYTYADMGTNLDEAEQLIRTALEHKPGDGYITDSLAWVYYQRGEYAKALPLLEEAVSLVPGDPVVREHLGDVYRKMGMTEKAIKSYRQSIENGHTDKAAIEAKINALTP